MNQEPAQSAVGAVRLYDAHNHLQDERLASRHSEIIKAAIQTGVVCMVVNGSSEADWPEVTALAQSFPSLVLPCFGYHPWYVRERSPAWQDRLTQCLSEMPSGVGEIGLDRWIKDYDLEQQEEVFVWQLRMASERNLPVSIHCLRAWGRLLELLRAQPRPGCGFLLHSYGGPREMIVPLAELGAYFSLPGYFGHERKIRQREAFREVPPDRLLIETDAPDQLLPPERRRFTLTDASSGAELNHPANLGAVYGFAAELLGEPLAALSGRIEQNFKRLFGSL